MNRPYRFFLLTSTLLGIIFLGCHDKDTKLASRWKNSEITVDGDVADWSGTLNYLEKEKLGFGVQNDGSNLYLCLQFDRQMQRRAMMFGFTVWFDSTAHDKKVLGIRFPIGMQNSDKAWTPEVEPSGEEIERPQPQQRRDEMLSEIEIIGPDKDDRNRISAHNAYGIQAAITEFSAEPIYELKIPLHVLKGQPYAIASNPGQTISLGFDMGELDRAKMREQMRGRRGGFGGGRPGGGGFGGGRPGGFRRGEGDRLEMSEPLKVWTKVQLAAQ